MVRRQRLTAGHRGHKELDGGGVAVYNALVIDVQFKFVLENRWKERGAL